MPSSDILNPSMGWDPTLGDSMNPSYTRMRSRPGTLLQKKAIGGTPVTRETSNTGHVFSLSWIGRTWACVQRLKWYYEQYEQGFFTFIDWDAGGRQYVGRFTTAPKETEDENNKWSVQNVTFEEVPGVAMLEYPSDWVHDAIAFFVNDDFGDQKVATQGAWTQTARVAIAGSTWTEHLQLAVGASYTTFDNPGNADEWAQYEYRGYGFRLYLLKGPEFGQCQVYVDGVLNTTVDCYAAADGGPAIVLTVQDLPLDIHRVQVVALGTKNGSATAANISWYALEVMR